MTRKPKYLSENEVLRGQSLVGHPWSVRQQDRESNEQRSDQKSSESGQHTPTCPHCRIGRSHVDIVDIAPLVEAETLITNTRNRVHHVGKGRLLNELIPNSRLIEFDDEDSEWWLADNWAEIADTHIEFLTGRPSKRRATSQFGVVVFTDLVASTTSSLALGDTAWQRRLDKGFDEPQKVWKVARTKQS